MVNEIAKKICLECGKEFLTYSCRINNGKGKYCSKSCAKIGKKPWNIGLTNETDERVNKNSEKRTGKKRTEEMKKTMSLSHKGQVGWNRGLKGFKHSGSFKVGHKCLFEKHPEETLKILDEKVFSKRRNKKYEDFYGEDKAKEIKIKLSAKKQGIPLEKWEKFIGFEPYTKEFNKAFKLAIKQREGFMCLKCGMREEDHLKLFGVKEQIHHIDYNKKLSIPENCCLLCRRCNSEVNYDREIWTKHFQSLLSKRYGYQYLPEGEIILNLNEEMKNGQ